MYDLSWQEDREEYVRTKARFGDTVRVGNVRIQSLYLHFVSAQLTNHKVTKDLLLELEDAVVRATPTSNNQGMPRGSRVSDPTSSAAERLMDEKHPTFQQRAHLRASVSSITLVFNSLTSDQQHLVSEVYFKRAKTITGVALDLNISERTAWRRRNEVLMTFAVELIGKHILLPIIG